MRAALLLAQGHGPLAGPTRPGALAGAARRGARRAAACGAAAAAAPRPRPAIAARRRRRVAAGPPDAGLGPDPSSALLSPAGGDAVAPLVSQFEANDDRETFQTAEGVVEEVEEGDAKFDYLGETTEGNLHLVQRLQRDGMVQVFGLSSLSDILTVPVGDLAAATQSVLDELGVPHRWPAGSPERGVYCSRTLNLRSIKAIGYDMDYTLIHYNSVAWEGRAYEYGLETLRAQGVPVEGLRFDPDLVIRGLIMDKELGNLIKVDRFGLVKRAMHGTRLMGWQEIRAAYGREVVNLRNEGRWVFLNTLFSVSEAVMYVQLVDRLDTGAFAGGGAGGALSYQGLYKMVAKALYRTHVEGKLKREIIQAPERFVEPDPEMAATLLDQKQAGKMLLLITNSDYEYTSRMMAFAYDPFLPPGTTWRDLFDMVIVQARKPDFFAYTMPLYEVVTPDGLMRPVLAARLGGLYCGGSARQVEAALGVEGDDILYVGDNLYTDAVLTKINFRWRTALIIRELEAEVAALAAGRPHREELKQLMVKKEIVGDLLNHLRLARQRAAAGGGPAGAGAAGGGGAELSSDEEEALNETLAQLLLVLEQLDGRIGPMLEQDGSHFNRRWGFLSRAGLNDKSQLCRQIEKYADVYTSRVSNFARYSPYMYFRSPTQSLAHDRNLTAYYQQLQAQRQADAELQDLAGQPQGEQLQHAHAAQQAAAQQLAREPPRQAGGHRRSSSSGGRAARRRQRQRPRQQRASPREPGQREAPGLTVEILSIALPVLATLAADPIAGLVDTAFIGRGLGASQLAGVGVALSVFNTVAKVVNVPLLSVTTSSVAAALGRDRAASAGGVPTGGDEGHNGVPTGGDEGRGGGGGGGGISAAITSSIVIAAAVGTVQAALLLGSGPWAAQLWGVDPASPLWQPASEFLSVRALGAPVTVLLLTMQGVFRGLQEPRTPLLATLAANAANVLLAWLCIFRLHLGVRGAATATVIAQALPLAWLLARLVRRHGLRLDADALAATARLFAPTGLLVLRTTAITLTYALATSLTARAPASAAAHTVSFQLWLSSSLLADSLAVAAQTLLARSVAAGDAASARRIVERCVALAAALGVALALALGAAGPGAAGVFTADPAVLALVAALWPVLAASQPVNALAFVWDGILFGAGGFRFAAVQMALCAAPAAAVMALGARAAGDDVALRLCGVWAGLVLVMAARGGSIAAAWAARRRGGPFRALAVPPRERA
ncbi:DTX44 [Scenedesmus sp. PABB004]|nr:DTX44 [Scenedesmus sp. PABB004]